MIRKVEVKKIRFCTVTHCRYKRGCSENDIPVQYNIN